MSKQLKLGSLKADIGEKIQGFIPVYNEQALFPVTLINGINDGKTVLITAGIHGSEYACIQTAIELAKELDPMKISGQIILIHPVNTQAFKARTFALTPEDNKNLNREFPGDQNGSITQKTAHFITHECQSKADFYIDLHGGDVHEKVTPFVYYPGIADEEVIACARAAAAVLDVKYMVRSGASTGAYTSAAIRGVPSLLMERGGAGVWTRAEVTAYKKDVIRILMHLKVIKGELSLTSIPYPITHAVYLEADYEGCWYPQVNPGEYVEKGQFLGEICDFFGNPLKKYFSEINGVILYMLVSLSTVNGDPLIAYGEVVHDE